MKTTVDINGPLLEQAKATAAAQGVTLRALIERGLRQLIAETNSSGPFKLRDASFKGRGLQPEAREASWAELREMAYKGRGT